jgi:RHS repeat-associated protein
MTAPPTTLRCQYRYDPLDRMIHQTQPDTPVHQRFYCKSRLATEIQGSTKHSIIQHDDLLLAQQQHEGNALDATLLATDLQRSVLHTLKKGLQPRPIAYSPYGHRPVLSGLFSLLGFNGERPDPVTGCYLLGNGYRAFNPVLMRFNSPDSWSPFGKGGFNAYAYCGGDPRNRVDETGHNGVNILINKILVAAHNMIDDFSIELMASKLAKTAKREGMNTQKILSTESANIFEKNLLSATIAHESSSIFKNTKRAKELISRPKFAEQTKNLELLTAKIDDRIRTIQLFEKHTNALSNNRLMRATTTEFIDNYSPIKDFLKESYHFTDDSPPLYRSLFPSSDAIPFQKLIRNA